MLVLENDRFSDMALLWFIGYGDEEMSSGAHWDFRLR